MFAQCNRASPGVCASAGHTPATRDRPICVSIAVGMISRTTIRRSGRVVEVLTGLDDSGAGSRVVKGKAQNAVTPGELWLESNRDRSA
jgi:hypothetical protein